jgi:hypothetical protein
VSTGGARPTPGARLPGKSPASGGEVAMTHDTDFHAWTREQAAALRRAQRVRVNTPAAVDWANIAEELELMGARERNEIRSRLQTLLEHLLELAYLPMLEPRHGWMRTVREQRDAIERTLGESPSLRLLPREALAQSYRKARRDFLAEHRVSDVPEACPFELDREVLAEEWLPAE